MMNAERSYKAELHCHTTYSDGRLTPEQCVKTAVQKKLAVLAITDHDTAEGALPFWEHQPAELTVVPGEEISTDRGHVLGLFVRESISPGPFQQVIEKLREQDAVIVLPHPVHIPLAYKLRKRSIHTWTDEEIALVDGLELFNAHNRPCANAMAQTLYGAHDVLKLSGSDAHFGFEIGCAASEIHASGRSLDEIKAALRSHAVTLSAKQPNHFLAYLWIGACNRLGQKRYRYP